MFFRPYDTESLQRDVRNKRIKHCYGHKVEKTVYMECGWNEPIKGKSEAYNRYNEVAMAQGLSNTYEGIEVNKGIIGYVDLQLEDTDGIDRC